MTYETIRLAIDGRGAARLTLARPEKHNALSGGMIGELTGAAHALAADPAVRLVLLDAEGASFCAGGDLGWMREQFDAGRKERVSEARRLAMMFKALADLPMPLIACIQGNAFGGGIGLISVCDLALAAETARFGLTEVRLGLIPATIGPYVVARLGPVQAMPLFTSGKIIDAAAARDAGLLTEVSGEDGLDEAVSREVEHLLAAAPGAAVRAKRLVRSLAPPITEAVIDDVVGQLADCWETAEAHEGISAFFERRKPVWPKAEVKKRNTPRSPAG